MNAKVSVVRRKDRRYLTLRWTDVRGRVREKSSGTTRRREAERKAAELERDLERGESSELTWLAFRRRYDREHLAGCDPDTRKLWDVACGHIDRLLNPVQLRELDNATVSRFAATLREDVANDSTRAAYLRALRAALNWAYRQRMLRVPPSVPMPRVVRDRRMKGRPITLEEFERMVDAIPSVVKSEDTQASWETLLWGLWYSGLRLSEALSLRWDGGGLSVTDIEARHPMLLISGEDEKGRTDRVLPMTPDFVEFLRGLEGPRRGLILAPRGVRAPRLTNMQNVSAVITKLGKQAGVVVDNRTGKKKFASAHDLRRSFGSRWSARLMPAVLMKLMRHRDISTTMRFYADSDAEQMAKVVWEASGAGKSDSFGDSGAEIELAPKDLNLD